CSGSGISNLTISAGAGTGGIGILQNSSFSQTLDSSLPVTVNAAQTWAVNNGDLYVLGVISSDAASLITKTGSATLHLQGGSTGSNLLGGLTLSAGSTILDGNSPVIVSTGSNAIT